MSTILTLHDPQTARGYYADGLWREDTLYSLLRDHAAARRTSLLGSPRARSKGTCMTATEGCSPASTAIFPRAAAAACRAITEELESNGIRRCVAASS